MCEKWSPDIEVHLALTQTRHHVYDNPYKERPSQRHSSHPLRNSSREFVSGKLHRRKTANVFFILIGMLSSLIGTAIKFYKIKKYTKEQIYFPS